MVSATPRKAVTIEDVAARAGVSRALVSIVFRGVPGASDASRAKVMRAAEQLSYRPDQRARLLGQHRSRTIGLSFGFRDQTHMEIVEAMYAAADGSGHELMLSPTAPSRHERRATQALLDFRCEALVLVGTGLSAHDLAELARQVPVVVVTRRVRSDAVDVVRTDDAAGARAAVAHLIELGHTRIVHAHGGAIAGAADRRNGYRKAMRDAGLEPMELVLGGRTESDGWRAADAVLASAATAVFTYNDQSAAGLMARLRDRGARVPDDISVIGFDDAALAASPGLDLTTMAQDCTRLARLAFELCIRRAGAPHHGAEDVVVDAQLIVRNSTRRVSSRPRSRT